MVVEGKSERKLLFFGVIDGYCDLKKFDMLSGVSCFYGLGIAINGRNDKELLF